MSTSSNKKIWDGYLRLNSSLTVPTVASFKSGENMPNVKWTKSIDVKGKVKLQDFELYIEDLTRSSNRGLMVVSLDWKEGTSKLGLESMKKIEKKYVEDGRVGIAKVINGIDLYVCPCSDTIMTLLAQYGFFKFGDKTTFEKNKDYLIGCVVWKRNQINHPSFLHQKSSGSSRTCNSSCIQLWTSISEQYRKNDPIEVWSPIRVPFESPTKYEPYKSYYSALVKSEDTPNVLPSLSVSTKLETSNPNLVGVTRPSSTTCDQNFHK
ncbi:unnamed protein product [Lathyrus sativus]|nr:unnamed protein product [Lathyrus sativus]